MSTTIYITVEDVDNKLAVPYDQIELERADSLNGSYGNIIDIPLIAGTYYYNYLDTTGDLNKWYRYRYSNGGLTPTDYSNPFRPEGVTRLKIRQEMIQGYKAGLVFTASGGDVNTVTTTDFRIKSTAYQTGRGKGSWLMPTGGLNAGVPQQVKSDTVPSTGTMNSENDWANVIAASTEVEWHWILDPDEENRCINRGLQRYYIIDRVPLVGVSGQEEYDLSHLPWLRNKRYITGLYYYPSADSPELPWSASGRWWNLRQDQDSIKLMIHPGIDPTTTLYLEVLRPMPALNTDTSSLPLIADLEYCAALAWDEVMAYMARDSFGGSEQTTFWRNERVLHQSRLKRLRQRNWPSPRYSRPSSPFPSTYVAPYTAR